MSAIQKTGKGMSLPGLIWGVVITGLVLRAGSVSFAGKVFNTALYDGRESVSIAEFAAKTGSKYAWVEEKKKGVLVYANRNYVFTAANRTVRIDEGAIHIPEPIGWDGQTLYIPVKMLDKIFNVSPSQIKPSEDIKIEKIILTGSNPTKLQIVA
jgi:hypothetical protein